MVVAYCSFCPKMPQKASKRGLLAQKSGGLLEFQSSGGLIKSGLLFVRIRYTIKTTIVRNLHCPMIHVNIFGMYQMYNKIQ